MDVCSGGMKNVTMCPVCDPCDFWTLSDTCRMMEIKSYFDNHLTVLYSVLMSLWAVFYLEFWKRYSAMLTHRWGVLHLSQEEEHPRPEYLAELEPVKKKRINFVTLTREPRPPFWRMKFPRVLLSWTVLAVLCSVVCISLLGNCQQSSSQLARFYARFIKGFKVALKRFFASI